MLHQKQNPLKTDAQKLEERLGDNYDPEIEIKKLADNFEQPHKFASIFCEAAETQISIANILKKKIKEILETDKEAIAVLKDIIREVDKEDWRNFIKKVGGLSWSLFLVLIGTLFGFFLKKFS